MIRCGEAWRKITFMKTASLKFTHTRDSCFQLQSAMFVHFHGRSGLFQEEQIQRWRNDPHRRCSMGSVPASFNDNCIMPCNATLLDLCRDATLHALSVRQMYSGFQQLLMILSNCGEAPGARPPEPPNWPIILIVQHHAQNFVLKIASQLIFEPK